MVLGAPALKPLSPIHVTLTGTPGGPFGRERAPTEVAHFLSLAIDVQTPFIRGRFEKISPEKIGFLFNPEGLLRTPTRAVLFSSAYPDVPFNEELFDVVDVSFAIHPAPKYGFSFPFLKEVRRHVDGPQAHLSNSSGGPPA